MRETSDSATVARDVAASIVRSHVPDARYRVFLFGSRAAGTARPSSDIDIGIEGPSPVPFDVLSAIADDLEEAPTLFSIDVVDFQRVPDKFRGVAKERVYLDV
jgi:predicted nucleotidyltransferase